jgi:hypothetical protein
MDAGVLLEARVADEAPAIEDVRTKLLEASGEDVPAVEDACATLLEATDDEAAGEDALERMPHFPKPAWQPVPQYASVLPQ